MSEPALLLCVGGWELGVAPPWASRAAMCESWQAHCSSPPSAAPRTLGPADVVGTEDTFLLRVIMSWLLAGCYGLVLINISGRF